MATTTKTEYKPGTLPRSIVLPRQLLFCCHSAWKRPEPSAVRCLHLSTGYPLTALRRQILKSNIANHKAGGSAWISRCRDGGKIEFQPPDHDTALDPFLSISRLVPVLRATPFGPRLTHAELNSQASFTNFGSRQLSNPSSFISSTINIYLLHLLFALFHRAWVERFPYTACTFHLFSQKLDYFLSYFGIVTPARFRVIRFCVFLVTEIKPNVDRNRKPPFQQRLGDGCFKTP